MCTAEYHRARRTADPEAERERHRRWKANNPDKLRIARARQQQNKRKRITALKPPRLKRDLYASVIISRDEARRRGLPWYYTGKPCVNGHDAQRYVSNQSCLACTLLKIRKTVWTPEAAERRARNANLLRQARANGDETYSTGEPCKHGHIAERRVLDGKCSECVRVRAVKAWQRWVKANPEKRRVSIQKWRRANPEKFKESNRQSRNRNKHKYKATQQAYWTKNRDLLIEKNKVIGSRRRAAKKGAGGSHTIEDRKMILNAQHHRCANCKADLRKVKKHLDHIIPIKLGGSDDKTNLQYLCALCNLTKAAKDPIQFAREQGRLL